MKMEPKFVVILPIIVFITALHSSCVSLARPVLHFKNILPMEAKVVTIYIDDEARIRKGVALLVSGQEYELQTDEDSVYKVSAQWGFRSTSFNAYEPSRDKDRADIFFEAIIQGFFFGYDNKTWTRIAVW